MAPNARRKLLQTLTAVSLGAVATSPRVASAASAPTADRRLDDLEAHQKITDVLFRYARGNDRLDAALISSCFWPDAHVTFLPYDGPAPGFVTLAMKILSSLLWCQHYITNVMIDVRGDQAVSECYFFAHHHTKKNKAGHEEEQYYEGRYLDRLERRDGVWKSAFRHGFMDFIETTPSPQPYSSIQGHSVYGPSDPIFKMLAELRAGRPASR